MKKTFRQSTRLLGAISGGLLISLAAIPQVATAQQQPISSGSSVNPCPSVFYEEPHNNRVLVPAGCPPNAFTQRMAAQGQIPVPTTPATSPQQQTTQQQIRMGVGGEAPSRAGTAVNPCPRIFYEEPHNSRVAVPAGCPPNAFTEKLGTQGVAPSQATPAPQADVIQPPAPEQRSQPIATITPANGKANVTLVNNTNAVIAYEVIGHTQRRLLAGKEQVVLQDLPLAVTITAVRNDAGFLRFTPTQTEGGSLQLSLDEATSPDNNQGAIRIQQDGGVYLN